MYKHIIWDWNGTLLNDVDLSLTAINIVLKRYNLPALERARYLEIFTFPVIEYYHKLGFDFTQTPFSIVGTEFIEEYTARMLQVDLHEGAEKFLKIVNDCGLTQSMLSAAKVPMLETLTRHHNLRHYFIRLVGLDNHYASSKLEVGRDWISELPYKTNEILYIGDTEHDIDVARELGVDIVLLALGHTSYDRLVKLGKRIFMDFSELTRWFESLKYSE